MKVRKMNDYKSIALPAELQGHRLFCRINSLFNQVIQYKINFYLARMPRMLATFVLQCDPLLLICRYRVGMIILFDLGFLKVLFLH